MKISLELDAIKTALDTITKLAPPTSGNINLVGAKGKLKVTSISDTSNIQVTVPCDLEGEGEFAVSMQSFRDAISGRAKLDLNYLNSVLHVKSGAYKAELATVDVIPFDAVEFETLKEWVVTPTQAQWLKSALRQVALKPTSIISQWMPAGIKIGAKSSFVACYDTQHMSWTNTKEITGDLEIVLPIDVVTSIVDVFNATNFKIIQGANTIQIVSKLINVRLSIPSTDDLPTLSQVMGKIKEIGTAKANVFSFSKSDMIAFLSNAKAVLDKGRAEISVVAVPKGVELMVKTIQGQVKNLVKGSGTNKFKIDYEYISEILPRCGADLELSVVGSSFVSLKLNDSHAMIALNQDQE